jgi:hypothetical protein
VAYLEACSVSMCHCALLSYILVGAEIISGLPGCLRQRHRLAKGDDICGTGILDWPAHAG